MVSTQSRKLRQVKPNLTVSSKEALVLPEVAAQTKCILACRLETETGMVMRFIIGQTLDDAQEADLMQESSEHGGFLRLDLQVPAAVMQSY